MLRRSIWEQGRKGRSEISCIDLFISNGVPKDDVDSAIANHSFIALCFDLTRQRANMTSSNIETHRATWSSTQSILASITPQDFEQAARQAEQYQPITDPKVKELFKMVNIVGRTTVGSDEKKNYMLVELKSSMVY
jgi:hypothetical protein